MKTSDFDYFLPPELIAQQPAARRDESRMMVVHRADGRLEHRRFIDLPDYLETGDVLVTNNTRVIPARLHGKKDMTGGGVELLLLEEREPGVWDVLLRARRRPRPGEKMYFADRQAVVIMLEEGELGRATVKVECPRPFMELVEEYGEPPLPPYIRRHVSSDQLPVTGLQNQVTGHSSQVTDFEDRDRYQTIYARESGAVAAPTAGLHFTQEIFDTLRAKGVERTEITLHVGLGTFRPVTAENIEDHRMEAERFSISEEVADRILRAQRVIAVGTTTARTLESSADESGDVRAQSGRTGIFIYPPFTFRVVDVLLTNFHLPKSTLLMMISAFAGRDLVLHAYAEAIRERYRFYSYGDCMLIL